MYLLYCDNGLRTNLGHHANSYREVKREIENREFGFRGLAYQGLESELVEELGATRFFRAWLYGRYSEDQLSGWLFDFERKRDEIRNDLSSLRDLPEDLTVYWNTARPAEIMALSEWLGAAFSPDDIPRTFVELGFDPGLSREGHVVHPDAFLYRYASKLMPRSVSERFHFLAFDSGVAEHFGRVLERPVITAPLPRAKRREFRKRDNRQPTVSFLGHQRPDKGYGLVPAVVESLLTGRHDVRILVHNGDTGMANEDAQLKAIASRNDLLILDFDVADENRWANLVSRSDLIVLPYDPAVFSRRYSAVVAEAIAAAVPLVVPAGTTLADTVRAYGDCGALIDEWSVPGVTQAVETALDSFDELAVRAFDAARDWDANNGPGPFVDLLCDTSRAGMPV